MNNASTFVNLSTAQTLITVSFDGTDIELPLGQNLAAALMAAGIATIRTTPVSQSPRGPFCMMGACYDCLVEIEGSTQQACMTQVSEGMIINRVSYMEQNFND